MKESYKYTNLKFRIWCSPPICVDKTTKRDSYLAKPSHRLGPGAGSCCPGSISRLQPMLPFQHKLVSSLMIVQGASKRRAERTAGGC